MIYDFCLIILICAKVVLTGSGFIPLLCAFDCKVVVRFYCSFTGVSVCFNNRFFITIAERAKFFTVIKTVISLYVSCTYVFRLLQFTETSRLL